MTVLRIGLKYLQVVSIIQDNFDCSEDKFVESFQEKYPEEPNIFYCYYNAEDDRPFNDEELEFFAQDAKEVFIVEG